MSDFKILTFQSSFRDWLSQTSPTHCSVPNPTTYPGPSFRSSFQASGPPSKLPWTLALPVRNPIRGTESPFILIQLSASHSTTVLNDPRPDLSVMFCGTLVLRTQIYLVSNTFLKYVDRLHFQFIVSDLKWAVNVSKKSFLFSKTIPLPPLLCPPSGVS